MLSTVENKLLDAFNSVRDALLNADDILKIARPLEVMCGVYFLISEKEIVYIRKSVSMHRRILEHKGIKRFDRFSFIHVPADMVEIVEQLYINKFKPKYNKTINDLDARLAHARKLSERVNGKGTTIP